MAKWVLVAVMLGACGVPESAPPETTMVVSVSLPTSTTTTQTITTLGALDQEFEASSSEVTAVELGASWHDGCPVGPEDLRRLTVSLNTFDGGVEHGSLVVHADAVDDLIGVFAMLFEAGFPVERMDPIELFAGDDDASMSANNTSAFNCRVVPGSNVWSQHAYGTAVDINPLLNPYVVGDKVYPPEAAAFADRSQGLPGMIVEGDVVFIAFESIGWAWGGTWESKKDYQHFSEDGR